MPADTRGSSASSRARSLLEALTQLRGTIDRGEIPADLVYRHRVDGGIAVLESVLELPPSLGFSVIPAGGGRSDAS